MILNDKIMNFLSKGSRLFPLCLTSINLITYFIRPYLMNMCVEIDGHLNGGLTPLQGCQEVAHSLL